MKRLILLAAIVLLAMIPWVANNRYVFHIATMIAIMAPLALSMNLMLRIGQLSMAHSAFMGIGAYASALLTMRLGLPPLASLLSGGVLAALAALVLGPVFLRIKGVYFVLLTYAFGQIVNLVFQEWTSLFGGNSGLYGIPKFSLAGYRLTAVSQYYVFALLFTVLAYWMVRTIERSDIGAILQSLNEDEMLSRSIGADALSWRIAVFTFSAAIAGISGGIYAFYIGFLSPQAFGFQLSVDLVVMNVIGGTSVALGPLLGAIVVVPLPELLREAKQYQLLIYGLCLMVFLIFIKQGLVSLIDRPRRKPA
ncbi:MULTISPECIES: branched-chain amino acid ABC transporter permease [unclassified Chelatococcus]|uniref:branched-chain amino acid ABC transporter permease n=1 Tax=unclassified Chelatococcus TaxID=2638111 RepID=UPI001BCCE9BF|nr:MULTISPECIES: branched-chain amino acid ABC transporter permease [unclassified Chelatococcus]CAH1648277.1 Amino acid/amide ABC transporter membrane protein 2 (HAAT family) [Hyphomicrobiales bacterium]MBS7742011.1 branched-chain amino acid ABC transporter permease [Chelatococcus sp. HY11]MBX3541191.1 branched-chain amino acid ABC transporter permease [Chelatococcus sp.]MCO5074916.1 branched-chain amino acid ABC transporter permease [Chelatococcus sp.]CAH1690662.1 Amino acid/amide ABC transpo